MAYTLSHRFTSTTRRVARSFCLLSYYLIFILLAVGYYRTKLRSDIFYSAPDTMTSMSLQQLQQQKKVHYHDSTINDYTATNKLLITEFKSYYVFLQKFPLESTLRMLFHTEVVVCPRETFAADESFLNLLDGLVTNILSPSPQQIHVSENFILSDTTKVPFILIGKEYWSKQSEPGCVQLGYGGADCASSCCGSPHGGQNTKYALNSRQAVIGNAMGEYKEVYLYGISGGSTTTTDGISGEDAYKAVCHGHMNAVEIGEGKFPVCVSEWSGHDYNPLTNNCNTFTSTLLKCVYGLSDAKPNLGVSDLRTVTCPTETNSNGMDISLCLFPTVDTHSRRDSNDDTKTAMLLVK